MSDCHLWLCSPWSYKSQIFPSTDIKYILEQKKFRITKQTLATLKLCNNTETAECRQTHWDLILLQVDINLFSVCFRSHCFQIPFFLTCREVWKKSNWNANRSNLLLSFGVGVKFLLFFKSNEPFETLLWLRYSSLSFLIFFVCQTEIKYLSNV